MPRLSWNEIEHRAVAFSARWAGQLLADLYDPLTMPKELTDAHHKLDLAVDRLYQRSPFATDADRIAMLFTRYQKMTENSENKPKRR